MCRSHVDRYWVLDAVQVIEADFNRSADTQLLRVTDTWCLHHRSWEVGRPR
jgi:hypothetical protein